METMSHFSAIRITPSNVVNTNSAPQSSPPANEQHVHVHRTIHTPSSPLRPASSSSATPQLHTINSITGGHHSTSITSNTMGVNTVSLSPGAAAVSRRSVSPRSTSPPGTQPQPATAGLATTPSSAASGGRCCETGRPIYTDPATGQTICSCQHEQMLQYQRLAQASLMGHGGPGGMHQLSMYSSAAYGPDGPGGMPPGAAGYMPAGAEQGHFYPNVPGMELKENMAGGAPWPYGYPYPYDPTMTPYSFNGYGMELNGARRKNATRETTSVLKAWLNEHKKNPYPTKGEKIMLAIITKMTLTQVSTWFANARRRLKKENKMTWEPKNRVDDDDPNICDDDDDDDDDNKSLGGGGSAGGMGMSGGMMKSSGTTSSDDGHGGRLSDSHQHLDSSNPGSPDVCMDMPGAGPMGGGYPMYHPMHFKPLTAGKPPGSSEYSPGSSTASTVNSKPRIWSLADMANDKAKDEGPVGATGLSNEYKPHSVPGMYGHPMAGTDSGLMSPTAILQRQNPTSYPHYIKSHLGPGGVGSAVELNKTDLFRSFTRTHATAAAAAAASAHLQAQPDYGFLESYQRALMHNGLAAASMHGMHPAHHPALTSLMAAGKPLHPQDPNSPGAAAAAAHAAAAAAAAHAAAHAAAASFPPGGLAKGPPTLQPPPMGGSHSARASPSSSSTSSRPENTTTPSSLPPPPPSSSSTTTGSPHVPPPPSQHLQHPSHHELPLHLQSPHLQQHQHHLQQQQHHLQHHHHQQQQQQQQQQQHSPQHHLQPQHMQQHLHHLRHSPPALPPAQQTLP